MKKILIAVLFLFSVSSIAQTIGGIQYMILEKTNEGHLIHYTDFNHRKETLKNFTVNDIEAFYKPLMQGFEKMPEGDLNMALENDNITLRYQKKLGVVSLRIFHSAKKNPDVLGMTRFLTKYQVMELFGKDYIKTKKKDKS